MKDTFYFSHDYNPTSDPKIQALIGEHGAVGYGLYWRIVEMLHEEETHKLPCKKYIYLALAKQMSTSVEQVEAIVKCCVGLCELFVSDDELFWSERVLRNIGKRTEISNKRSEAGKKSAELRKTLTSVQQVSASVQQNPTKERKGKKRKEKNIDIQQAENLDESYIKFNSWLIENAPIVSSLKTQMTQKQFLDIKSKYSSSRIINTINNMENYIPTPQKYRNVYLTFLKFVEREYRNPEDSAINKPNIVD